MVGSVLPQLASASASAGRWLLESGIQEPSGGVARYHRCDIGENQAVSAEITGYAISAFVYLHRLTAEPCYREAAHRAARFLLRNAWDAAARAFPFEGGNDGAPLSRLAYFFDSGIIVRGLLALWRISGEPELLATAKLCAEAMVRDFATEAGSHPILLLPSKQPLPHGERWSRSPGCYQLKAALAWHELDEDGECPGAREHYEVALRHALATHDSFLDGAQDAEDVVSRLHAYCYFLEGLLPSVSRADCASALAGGLERVENVLRSCGPLFERSDVRAQLLRLRLFAAAAGIVPLDSGAAAQEAGRIAEFQAPDCAQRLRGGFFFGRKRGELLPHVNPASTAFCLQALEFWRQHQAGEFRSDWRILV